MLIALDELAREKRAKLENIRQQRLLNIFYRVPPEISREILRFLDPIAHAKNDRQLYILESGPFIIKWCHLCGEKLTDPEWIVMMGTEENSWIFYDCEHCHRNYAITL
tara:strand:+ start:224 stop:547 length:324 start_codon:yes stop_codon:yes gene_type:complete